MNVKQSSAPGGAARWVNIVGVIFLTYTIATFDRTNLGLALPDMTRALRLSSTQAGLAGGIFSWGYVVTFLAAGWLAPRYGARRLIAVCLCIWGGAALLTGMVRSFPELVVVRFVLGMAEGPVWTTAAMLTAQWFTQQERGRAFAFWNISAPMGALVAGPVSGLLLSHFDWRVMLVAEGVPAWIWALVWWWRIPASLDSAAWLPAAEKTRISRALQAEQAALGQSGAASAGAVQHAGWKTLFSHRAVWFLVSGFSLINLLVNGFTLWLPTAIKSASAYGMLGVGFLSALPWVADIVGIILISRRSDRYQERRRHAAIPMMIAGCLLLTAANVGSTSFVLQMALFSLMGFFVHMFLPLIFTYTTEILPRHVAIPAIAFIGAIGNLFGGFVGPTLVGWLTGLTHDFRLAFSVLAVCGIAGGVLVLQAVRPTDRPKDREAPRAGAAVPR